MEKEFNDIEWHDAVIQDIIIDRENPGHSDIVIITIFWPNGCKGRVIFEDVYFANLVLNFGVIAKESIYSATETNDSIEITEVINKWRKYCDIGKLCCYTFNTASTYSTIKIIAKHFKIVITSVLPN